MTATARATGLPASVASLNHLLAERGQFGRGQQAAMAMSYMVHAILILAVLLIARKQPYREYGSQSFSVMSVRPLLGTPDGDPGGPPIVVPEPAVVPDRVAPPAREAETAPPVVAPPAPQPTAKTGREVKPSRATPTPTRAKPTPREQQSRATPAGPTAEQLAAAAAARATAERNAALLTTRGGRGSPQGTLGGAEGGGLGTLMFSNQWYVGQVRDIVYMNWANPFTGRPQPDAPLRVVVAFRIGRDGTVTDVGLKQGSGNDLYDRSGLRAVQHARLPPLPRDYRGRDVQVSFEFLSKAE